jgi:hypothetical protein
VLDEPVEFWLGELAGIRRHGDSLLFP